MESQLLYFQSSSLLMCSVKQQRMAQAPGATAPHMGDPMQFQAARFGLAHPWLLQPFGKSTRRWKICVSLSI